MKTSLIAHRGRVFSRLLLALVVVSAVAIGCGAYLTWGGGNRVDNQAMILDKVSQGIFRHVVTERGEVESSSNVDVICEVQSKNTAGTAILDVVPEGTIVKVGEQLARLDASALDDELSRQEIECNTSQAAMIQAESALATAKINRQEYLDGTFKQEEQVILGEISVAEENLRRAEDYAKYSETLAAKGYVTDLQLEADKFAVEKSGIDLATAQTKLTVIRDFTRPKMVGQLDAEIKTAEANLVSAQNTYKRHAEKFKLIEEQIGRCIVKAPADGQVVYANKGNSRGSEREVIIEPGALVRERQVIIRLPDPKKMQVKAKINESRIDRVREGQPAIVRVDAFPEREMTGVVKKVDDYPIAGSWWSTVKEYGTTIEIFDPPEGMRPGMTAEVRIQVAELPDAVQVPVQAIVEHGGDHFCLVSSDARLSAAKVAIGPTNDKFVVITQGVTPGQSVVVNPRGYLTAVDLPTTSGVKSAEKDAWARASERTKTVLAAAERPEPAVRQAAATSSDAGGATLAAGGPASGTKPSGDKPRGQRPNIDLSKMSPAQMARMALDQYDSDKDGKLSQGEAPEHMSGNFSQTDSNSDGNLDLAELTAATAKFIARMRSAGVGAPGGAPSGGGGNQVAAPNAGATGQ
ncbi:MAG: HlyD family efflux transporter periplasmic adaptor subunit [Pirellulales bacterium]|nr:HlyD family efflux transporter periplasmic adaptor subunit [Pirellulales bacterium]